MEYCGVGSVADVLNLGKKTLTENQIARIVRDALRGLAYLHQKGCIHRDVKAGNIVINTQGCVKLGILPSFASFASPHFLCWSLFFSPPFF